MTKKQKRNLLMSLFLIVLAFLIVVAIFFNITVTAESSKFVIDMNDFAVKIVNNFTENVIFYGLIVVAIVFGVRFFRKRK